MPLHAIAINDFAAPIMRKPVSEDELKVRISKLYEAAQQSHPHDIPDAKQVIEQLSASFRRGGCVYVGMFNDKPICVLGCFDDGMAGSKRLQYLAVHPQNLNRGIEAKFIKQVYDAEVKKGVRRFEPVDTQVHQIMQMYELLSVKT